jgi:hypothetical protein
MFMSFSVRTLKEKAVELGACTSFSGSIEGLWPGPAATRDSRRANRRLRALDERIAYGATQAAAKCSCSEHDGAMVAN